MTYSTNIKTVAVLPAYNESSSIQSLIKSLKPFCDVLVVDDGSEDATSNLAILNGAHLLKHSSNQGYDKALETGFNWAFHKDYKYVLSIDADGQHSPQLVTFFLKELEDGADVVVGMRNNKQRWAEGVFSLFTSMIWQINDPLCGMKGYRTNSFKELDSFCSYDSIGTELLIRALKSNYIVREIEIPNIPRIYDSTSRFGDGLNANFRILKSLFLACFFAKRISK